MLEIIPAILTSDPKELEEKISLCEGIVKRVQIDIIDGIFVNNKTIDPSALENIDTTISLDFHLMVRQPIHWVEKCVRAGGDRIIGQIEMMESQVDFVGKVQEVGLSVGLALDLDTDVSKIDPTILTSVDVILLMAVKAGFGGQKFNIQVLDKIKKLAQVRSQDQTPFKICVDGGENEDVIDDTYFAGADEVVIGKRLFKGEVGLNIENMRKSIYKKNEK